MAFVYFPSLADAEVIDLEFLKLNSDVCSLRLLVDSGFTGRSGLVLPSTAADLVWATLPATHTAGALQGLQDRAWVTCQIAGLNYGATHIAILADISALSLPTDVAGMVGLSFLRQFESWGSQRTESGWRFFLSDGCD